MATYNYPDFEPAGNGEQALHTELAEYYAENWQPTTVLTYEELWEANDTANKILWELWEEYSALS